jgi:hypothetical protein
VSLGDLDTVGGGGIPLEQAVMWAREIALHHGMDGRTCAALLAEIDRLHAVQDRLLARCDESDAEPAA